MRPPRAPSQRQAGHAERASELVHAFCDPTVDVVWPIRGGYGCLPLMNLIDWNLAAGISQHDRPQYTLISSYVKSIVRQSQRISSTCLKT